MKVSVALAAYNGEKYIEEQLKSILPQLSDGDEIIISDDGSSDRTVDLVKGFNCDRIHIFRNPGKGVRSNFENAIRQSKNEIIVLCDQDDVWSIDKINIIKKYFRETGADLIVSDAFVTDENLNVINDSFYKIMNSKGGFIRNFVKNSFVGCCMAFRNRMKKIILPFPHKIPMHDSWIGLLTELNGKVEFIPEKLVYYRRHDANATVLNSKSPIRALLWRKQLLLEILRRQYRLKQSSTKQIIKHKKL